ncbi:MAG: GNAT family N-acetyltransferase [Prevotella sp.]|nr:GNAT family N-acetyltransferase [Prevotella sp.]
MNSNEEVILRAMEPEDLDLLYKIENDQKLWDVGNTNVPYSRYVLHDYIANASGDIYTDQQVRLIVENGVGETVGIADITNFDAKNCRAEVGIVIAREFRLQGYALRTLRKIAVYSLNVLHLHQLYAIVDANNQASIELFTKADYQQVAELKEWLYDGRKYHHAILMQIFL